MTPPPLPNRIVEKRSIDPAGILLNAMTHVAKAETSAKVFDDSVFVFGLCLFLLEARTQRDISARYRTSALRRHYEQVFVASELRSREELVEREPDG